VPFHQDAYGGDAGFPRKGQALLPAPAVGSYNGLIFISLDADAPPLAEYLGDFRFYLDGDMYHTPQTHTSVVEIGLFREPKAEKRKDGTTYWAGNGGGTTYKLPPGTLEERLRYVGYPDSLIETMKQAWSREQQDLIGRDGFMFSAATAFPNMSMVHNWPRVEDSDDVLPFITLRSWQPVGPDETEVLSWFAVDAAAPEEFKALSYKAYLMCFGSTGMFEQDDVENWVSLTSTAAGSMARRLLLNSRMGLLARWADYLERPAAQPARARIGTAAVPA
jgi:phenylpropionate dioxygenase-like ring-hydroxylating dioxygenase large terminal subunit